MLAPNNDEHMKSKLIALLIIILLLSTNACSPTTEYSSAKSKVVERYLQAKVSGDTESVRMLLCAEMEHLWEREAHSFDIAGGAEIQGLSCQNRVENDIVECQGEIIANYGNEARTFPLGAYRVIFEGGEWRWCGEIR
jgi:hypothetical protein